MVLFFNALIVTNLTLPYTSFTRVSMVCIQVVLLSLRNFFEWDITGRQLRDSLINLLRNVLNAKFTTILSMRQHKQLKPFTTSWPFCQWGLDLVGKMHPSSSNGHKFIITATEYFTKWIEAVPMTTKIGKQISSFIINYLICKYGIPSSIITNTKHPLRIKMCKSYVNDSKSNIASPHHTTHRGMVKQRNQPKKSSKSSRKQ